MNNNIFEQSEMNPTFIFVDGSYYNFYRYYALSTWWRNAYPEEPLDDPYKNEKFVEKFKKTHVENLLNIPKKLKIHKTTNPILIVGKDCKREHIWRNELFPNYKGTRGLFIKGGAKAILKHPKLEADDCIALSVKLLVNRYPQCHIYIITSDRDYLQLNAHNVDLYNLSFKNIAENKNSTGDAKMDLEIKIIMGDTSDNIPSVFPKCGPKTAEKCVEDPEFFKKKMADNPAYYAQYELNKKLVSFDRIPEELVKEFMLTIKK